MVKEFPPFVKLLSIGFGVVIALYMLVPILVVAGVSINTNRFLSFPPEGLTLEWYSEVFTGGTYLQPFLTSVIVAIFATLITVTVGTAAALAITRFDIPYAGAIQGFLLSPLIVPTIILGIGTLSLISALGEAPSVWILVLAHAVITIPYVMRTVMGVMANHDRFTEEAARTLGASGWHRYRSVVLPMARPGIVAGGFFAFNVSFDDAVVALFLRSHSVETLPVAIYGQLEFDASPTVAAVSTLMVLVTVVVMIFMERTIGLGKAFI
ncbi:ABC transporter permease [Yaniella flava]|uniref:ABC transporter permease n=1 Tax=Yaniella flava TaxID=287930 RepID=A0ABP5FP11_9MICC